MKKGKVFSKGQIIAVAMVLSLGAAVWLNMKFSSTEKYLGEAKYVSTSTKAVETSAKAKTDSDYFSDAKKERDKALKEAQGIIEETLKGKNVTDEQKEKALADANELANRVKREQNVETLLKAKGFEKVVAIIGDKNVSVVVKSDGLTSAKALQIQDIVTQETGVDLANVKIVTVG